jgi:hypothetical protein
MSNLFQITAKARELAFALESGELTPELENELIINQEELQHKSVNYGYVIKSFESDLSLIDEEIKRLQALKKAKIAAVDRMKETVLYAMNIYGIEKVGSPTLTVSVRNNPEATEIINEEQIPAKFKTEKVSIVIDKTAIKKAIQSGDNVTGAILTRSQSLQIK